MSWPYIEKRKNPNIPHVAEFRSQDIGNGTPMVIIKSRKCLICGSDQETKNCIRTINTL